MLPAALCERLQLAGVPLFILAVATAATVRSPACSVTAGEEPECSAEPNFQVQADTYALILSRNTVCTYVFCLKDYLR